MSTGKYIPVNMRNMKTDEKSPSSNANQRNNDRRPYRKSKWEVEQEQKALEEKKRKEKEEKDLKNCELTDSNFPTLGAPVSKTRVWGGEKSFASMAVEWEHQKKKEEDEKKQQKQEEQAHNQYRRHNVPLPQFHNVRRFIEPEDEVEEESKHDPSKNDDGGWTFVDRKKIRREKTVEEKFAQAAQSLDQEDDNTVWGETAPQEHETCWDTRP